MVNVIWVEEAEERVSIIRLDKEMDDAADV